MVVEPKEVEKKPQIDIGKEAAMEAEVRAARERALVPLDTRIKSFREMLTEKEVWNWNYIVFFQPVSDMNKLYLTIIMLHSSSICVLNVYLNKVFMKQNILTDTQQNYRNNRYEIYIFVNCIV